MTSNTYTAAAGRLLAVGITTLMVISLLSPGAGAATTKTLYKFTGGADGAYPNNVGSLVFDAKGNLYGTTQGGGAYNSGVVFKLTPNPDGTWTETVLYSFTGGGDGSLPRAGLIFDAAGNLYGTSTEGGAYDLGTVFQLTQNPDESWVETVLYSFVGTDGSRPGASLILDATGNLYGTTANGGAYGCGTVFQLTPSDGTWVERVLVSFTCSHDGTFPKGQLLLDPDGSLYGTTTDGGRGSCYLLASGCGVVFQLMPNPDGTWTEKALHTFMGSFDGANPIGMDLISDNAGNLYGTSSRGGAYGWGTVFELSPNRDGSWREKALHHFNWDGGAKPVTGLIFDASGNLYGTTRQGGSCYNTSGCGTVFKLIPSPDGTWTEGLLYSFSGGADGEAPLAGLIFDQAGNLYGTTRGHPDTDFGSVFETTP